MSFGFSVGDFIAAAELAHTLYQSLCTAKGSAQDYRELIAELNIVHKVLLQVNQLQASNQLALATTNNLLFIVASASDAIEAFLINYRSYGPSLRDAGSGNPFKDVFKKGSWAIQMPKKVDHLRRILSTMLASINCMVTLTCYYNTGYDANMKLNMSSSMRKAFGKGEKERSWIKPAIPSHFEDVEIQGVLKMNGPVEQPHSAFQVQKAAPDFFRPGQVFSLKITSAIFLSDGRPWRKKEVGRLPLEPPSELQQIKKQEEIEDKMARLAQILSLPLRKMVPYCSDVPGASSEVTCNICGSQWEKDFWAAYHFRLSHWHTYAPMVGIKVTNDRRRREPIVPVKPLNTEISIIPELWITADDIVTDVPMESDEGIMLLRNMCSSRDEWPLDWPVLIRRFIVVRSGLESCLCIGIHTYGGRGCGSQLDPHNHAILHSSKEVPELEADENAVTLKPIRMKPEHPSTALPRTARVHFGRAYVIPHDYAVMPLGLIHSGSMDNLNSQFERHVLRSKETGPEPAQEPEKDMQPLSLDIARNIREQVAEVLGQDVDIKKHIRERSNQYGASTQDMELSEQQASEASFAVEPVRAKRLLQ